MESSDFELREINVKFNDELYKNMLQWFNWNEGNWNILLYIPIHNTASVLAVMYLFVDLLLKAKN